MVVTRRYMKPSDHQTQSVSLAHWDWNSPHVDCVVGQEELISPECDESAP